MDKSYGEKKRYGKMKFKTMRVHAFLNRLANDKTFGNTLPHRKTATLIHYSRGRQTGTTSMKRNFPIALKNLMPGLLSPAILLLGTDPVHIPLHERKT